MSMSSFAQKNYYSQSIGKFPLFHADYAAFRGEESKNLVEVNAGIKFSSLQFVKQNDGYAAHFEMNIEIARDGSPWATRFFTDTVFVADFYKTISVGNSRLIRQEFLLPPGSYQCTVSIKDLETRREAFSRFAMNIRSFPPEKLIISDLQFAKKISFNQDDAHLFARNGRYIEPNPANAFGYFAHSMHVFYEIYGLNKYRAGGEKMDVHYTILKESGNVVKSLLKKVQIPGDRAVHTAKLSIGSLPVGIYTFKVEVISPDGKANFKVSKMFVIGADPGEDNFPNYDWVIQQIELIAEKSELRQLQLLPPEKQRHGVLSFWLQRDPTPGTAKNELMIEFYRRVHHSNHHYYSDNVSGWQSDRGKTYLRYGTPDSIVKKLADRNRVATEMWLYNRANLQFLFTDRDGRGIFELASETQLTAVD